MIKKYKLTINNTRYDITLETESSPSLARKAPEAAFVPVSSAASNSQVAGALKPVAAPAQTSAPDASKITSPMPGNIWKIHVKPGDEVKKGDVMIILEAMKMENEIMASRDGKVASVEVNEGQSVDTGALLCTLE